MYTNEYATANCVGKGLSALIWLMEMLNQHVAWFKNLLQTFYFRRCKRGMKRLALEACWLLARTAVPPRFLVQSGQEQKR